MTTQTTQTTGWTGRCCYGSGDTSEVVDFGVRDEKGRTVGGYAVVEPCGAFQPVAGQPGRSEFVAVEGKWRVRTQSTRDGKTFGAISRSTDFAGSIDDAKALALGKLDAARKRVTGKSARRAAEGGAS